MKKLNIILVLLCCLTSVGYAQVPVGNKAELDKSIQSRGYKPYDGYHFQKGDTIIIKEGAINYLTGEEMSKWVYQVMHLVEKQSGARFPDGVLISGIYSWVKAGDLMLLHPVDAQTQTEQSEQLENNNIAPDRNQGTQYEQSPSEDTNTPARMEGTQSTQTQSHRDMYEPQVVEKTRWLRDTLYIPNYVYDTLVVHDTINVSSDIRHSIDRFSIGVRGGLASLLHNTGAMKDNLGFDACLDLQYAHYWKKGNNTAIGLLVGGSVGFLRGGLHGNVNDQYEVLTSDGKVQYTITAQEAREVQDQIMVEVPLMLSIVADNGFFFNVGPRISFPVWTKSSLSFTEPHVTAFFPSLLPNQQDWHVMDEMVMGRVDEGKYKGIDSWKNPVLNVLIGGELGYEFQLKNGNALGLGVYGSYGVYSLYEGVNAKSFIDIVPPTSEDGGKAAVVNIVSPSDVYTTKMGMFDVGLKLAYHLQWKK